GAALRAADGVAGGGADDDDAVELVDLDEVALDGVVAGAAVALGGNGDAVAAVGLDRVAAAGLGAADGVAGGAAADDHAVADVVCDDVAADEVAGGGRPLVPQRHAEAAVVLDEVGRDLVGGGAVEEEDPVKGVGEGQSCTLVRADPVPLNDVAAGAGVG